MAFYYVKTGGTATGDAGRYATAQTGSFAAMGVGGYYDNLKAIFADAGTTGNTAIVSTDNVRVSDLHDKDYATTTTLNITSCSLESVDDASVATYKAGAKEGARASANQLTIFSGAGEETSISGVSFDVIGGLLGTLTGTANSSLKMYNVSLSSDASGRQFRIDKSGVYLFTGCTYASGSGSTGGMLARGGAVLEFDDCVFTGGALLSNESTTGAILTIQNSDLSGLTGAVFINTGAASSDGDYVVNLYRCSLPVITQVVESGQVKHGMIVNMLECTDFIGTLPDAFFEYHYRYYGEWYSSNVAYLNYKYDGTNKSSIRASTSAATAYNKALNLKLCTIPAQNLSTTDKTYRVNLLLDTGTKATLSDTECWIEVVHNDNASQALGVVVTSRNADILATGTELTTSAETWLGTLPVGNKAYQIDIILSAASLTNVTDSNVEVYVNLATANTDVYVCPAVQVGT